MATIELHHLSFVYGNTPALSDVTLTIADGELHTLLGPSGCGKTTTLRLVAGFLTPSSGDIRIDGKDATALPPERRAMGVVFQNYALFPSMNVLQNVAYGVRMQGIKKRQREKIAQETLELVGLSHLANRNIDELSGGQQQRVAIARALAPSPSVLLLDEPMANLDEELRVSLRAEIRRIQQSVGVTTLFITHDQQEALSLSDTVSIMNEGRVVQTGTPHEIYEHPANDFVAEFTGTMNCIPDSTATDSLLHARPETLRLTSAATPRSLCKVEVSALRYRGFATEYVVSRLAPTPDPTSATAALGSATITTPLESENSPITVLALSNPSYEQFSLGDQVFVELIQ